MKKPVMALVLALLAVRPGHAQTTDPPGGPLTGGPLTGEARFVLRALDVSGAHVLPQAEIDAIAAPHLGHPVGLQDIEDIRRAITGWYTRHGYLNSGAVVPDQAVADGRLALAVTEGSVTAIDITGTDHFVPAYFTARLQPGLAVPFNIGDLERRQQIILQTPYLRRLDLDVEPGAVPGQARLRGVVTEAPPYSLSMQIANDQSPTVGEVRGQLAGSIGNILGYGDAFAFTYGHSAGLDDGSASYSVPIAADDTTLHFRYDINSNFIITQDLKPLNIANRYDNVSVGLSRPFWRSLEQTLTLGATFERRRSRSYLLDAPFSFVQGSDNGKTNVTVLRLYQDWLDQTSDRVLDIRTTLSIGLQALGATVTSAAPSGQFSAWFGQAQYVRRLPALPGLPADPELVVRAQLQLSGNALFPIEQISIGGIDTVRGYREYLISTDNGFIGSLELRTPVTRLKLPYLGATDDAGIVQLATFYDQGVGWNVARASPPVANIASIGAGLRWLVGSGITAEIYYAHGLRPVHTGSSLQDKGIYFRVVSKVY